MNFQLVAADVKVNQTNETRVLCFEHEIPILQARFGVAHVTPVDDDRMGIAMTEIRTEERDENNQPIFKKIPLDRSLAEEWQRLIEKNQFVQVSDTVKQPAPLVAYPRGVRDLEDFYIRLGRDIGPATPEEPVIDNTDDNVLVDSPSEKPMTEREQIKAQLDGMGIEYKGNAKTVDLKALLDEVTDGSTAVQDEG